MLHPQDHPLKINENPSFNQKSWNICSCYPLQGAARQISNTIIEEIQVKIIIFDIDKSDLSF